MSRYKSLFSKIFKAFSLTLFFHALIGATYFIAFPVNQNFAANAANLGGEAYLGDSFYVLLINFFILITSVGLVIMFNFFFKQLAPQKQEIKIAPFLYEQQKKAMPSQNPNPSNTAPKRTEKKKIILQF